MVVRDAGMPEHARSVLSQPTHILVVDDNRGVREVVAALLADRGCRVSLAGDGDTMRHLLDGADPVDAVVLDVIIPGETVSSLAQFLGARRLPVVMISGSNKAIDIAEQRGLQLLRKPFTMRQLYAAIDHALASGEFGQRSA
jgi:two-component system, OmpR family, response regulator